ncbi:hypothetical protein [Paraburkholderia oxyphila]|nr:hypothetical protein [Paraburkholderia oxyphila]
MKAPGANPKDSLLCTKRRKDLRRGDRTIDDFPEETLLDVPSCADV